MKAVHLCKHTLHVDRDLRRGDIDNGRSLIEAQLNLGTDLSLDASNVPANSPIVSNVE